MHREAWIVWMCVLALATGAAVAGGVATARGTFGDVAVYEPVPSISLDPSSGPAGTLITIHGGGFFNLSDGDIELFFDGTPLGRPRLEPDGTFEYERPVPDEYDPGEYEIVAEFVNVSTDDYYDLQPPSAVFVIEPPPPSLTLSPQYALPGSVLTITGEGFASGSSPIILTFGGSGIGSITSTDGMFTFQYFIPLYQEAGEYEIRAVQEGGSDEFTWTRNASADFTVEPPHPSLTLSPQSALPGPVLTITGTGFAPGSSLITLTFGGSGIGTTLADEEGMFTFQYSVPAGHVPGVYPIEAVQEGGSDEFAWSRTASADFTVVPEPREELSLTLSPEYGEPGSVIAVSGSGFPYEPGAQILLLFDGATVGSFSLRDDGTFAYRATVPADLTPGPCEVRADEVVRGDVIASASAVFDVRESPPETGSIEVSTSPPDAWITMDGDDVGTAPIVLDPVESGMHTVTAVKSGYREETRQVEVTPAERTVVFIDLGETAGTLEVCASCEGARVYIDGRYAGTCPLVTADMVPGTHHVRVCRDGYLDYHADVSVENEGYTYLYASMMPFWPVAAGLAGMGIGVVVVIRRLINRPPVTPPQPPPEPPQQPRSRCTRPAIEVEGGLETGRDASSGDAGVRIDVEGGIERGER